MWLPIGGPHTLRRQPLVGSSSRRHRRSRQRENKRGCERGSSGLVVLNQPLGQLTSASLSPLGKRARDLKGHGIAHDGITGSGQFMRDRLPGHHDFGLGAFPLIKLSNLGLVADRNMRGFHKRTGQLIVAILRVALHLAFPIAELGALHAAAGGGKLPDRGEPPNLARLEHDRQG